MTPPYITAAKIIENHGKESDTYKCAAKYLLAEEALVKKYEYNEDEPNAQTAEYLKQADKLDTAFLNDLRNCYYQMLKDEYAFLTSDEQITEAFKSYEHFFEEDGTMRNS